MTASVIKGRPLTDEEIVKDFLNAHPEVQIIIMQWVDVTGVVRNRLTTARQFVRYVAERRGPHVSQADVVFTASGPIPIQVFYGQINPPASPLIADVSSLRTFAHDSAGIGNAAVVMVEANYLGLQPRANLRSLVEKAKNQHDLTFLLGFELEFCFLEKGSLIGAVTGGAGLSASSGLRSDGWPIINEVMLALAEVDIHIEQAHREFGESQWEVSLPPLPPMESVDAYVYARETIKSIAAKHGLVATFFPTPYSVNGKQQATGQHIHISAKLGEDDDGTAEDSKLKPDELMSGILSHLPALTALGLAQEDSYERVGSGKFLTGGIVGWGDNHRDMPVRRITKNHWELRINDGTSNPYVMAAGIIGAALDRKPLTIGPADKWPLMITPEEKKELGMTRLLPISLEAALTELEDDFEWAKKALGEAYPQWYVFVKRGELDPTSKLVPDEKRAIMVKHY